MGVGGREGPGEHSGRGRGPGRAAQESRPSRRELGESRMPATRSPETVGGPATLPFSGCGCRNAIGRAAVYWFVPGNGFLLPPNTVARRCRSASGVKGGVTETASLEASRQKTQGNLYPGAGASFPGTQETQPRGDPGQTVWDGACGEGPRPVGVLQRAAETGQRDGAGQ